MALMKDSIDRPGVYFAEAQVSASTDVITFSLAAYTEAQDGGRVFLRMSPLDAEVLAAMLLQAAIVRRTNET